MEHVLRSCILGLRITADLELEESERAVVYYVALLAWLGCHADAHEQSAWFGWLITDLAEPRGESR